MPIDSFRVHEATELTGRIRSATGWDQIRGLGERGCAVFLIPHSVMEAEVGGLRRRTADRRRHPELKAQDHGWLRLQVWSDRRG
jgi:hypothetical protein